MKIKKHIIKNLIIQELSTLLEELNYFDNPDEDRPGNNQFVATDKEENYTENGNTHGGYSHAIKHYIEFAPEKVKNYLSQVAEILKQTPDVFLKNAKNNNIISQGEQAKSQFNDGNLLNTLDLVNDKIKTNDKLTSVEQDIQKVLINMSNEYVALQKKYMDSAIDVDNIKDEAQLKQILDAKKIIKFTTIYKAQGKTRINFLNLKDSGLAVIDEDDKLYRTFFRIDKKGADFNKIAAYFIKASDIQNDVLKNIFLQTGQTPASKPQQNIAESFFRMRKLAFKTNRR